MFNPPHEICAFSGRPRTVSMQFGSAIQTIAARIPTLASIKGLITTRRVAGIGECVPSEEYSVRTRTYMHSLMVRRVISHLQAPQAISEIILPY